MRLPDVAAGLPVAAIESFGDPAAFAASPLIACIPACNEAGWIGRCLTALDRELSADDGVLLLANGCTDETVAIARGLIGGWTRPVLVVDVRWRGGEGSAPLARRLVLDLGHALAREAVLVSIDGDTMALPGLRAAYAAEFDRGFDLVCGRIGFLPEEAALLPPADPESEAIIRAYRETSRHIAALIRPDPDNPWPHHGNIGGANFALRGRAYALAGPLPTPSSGEDRALRRRFEANGLRIRYCEGARVETSCRLEGRATGGLSEELRRNRIEADPLVDELLEPPATLVLRRRAQARFLGAQTAADRLAALEGLKLGADRAFACAGARDGNGNGPSWRSAEEAWQSAEEASPVLRRTRLRLSDLRRHLPALRQALETLRHGVSDHPPAIGS
ncbi:hypothetical protein ASG43_16775 [Aureimonas sp. Leaf454]|uniref:glycosyltransferase n=1 Tax=Aureimonas sp. Leaf454 TaxID=1736381 RepID=UPI0006F4DB7F|nr:glycosyltransferase [Aureimonas sp. Leaf454]KQT43156.1 hypothetical protein ASG43_16775 [Aureimonas sp. Leaf454]